jgi:hypothetical protein
MVFKLAMMSLMTFSISVMCAISTVVCIYLKGRDIRAEGTPLFEYAKASVSVPVLLEAASL